MSILMQMEYTAIVKQQGKWWLGWIEEVPGVNCQEARLFKRSGILSAKDMQKIAEVIKLQLDI
jgi:hypothetical protein